MNRDCETCIKRKTIYCPNSADCFATENKPHYQHKIMLLEENEKLKKQLENCYCNRTDCASRIKDSKKYDSLEQKVESQQKEFILYLRHLSNWYSADGVKQGMVNEILQKYREIIGGNKDEN